MPEDEYELIVLMDVLEHIDNDFDFLNQIIGKMRKNKKSYLVITVPAHQKLFSNHDRFLDHYRRYESKTLEEIIKKTRLDIISTQYFFVSLYFARTLLLKIEKPVKQQKGLGGWRFKKHNLVTLLVRVFLSFDLWLGCIAYSLGLPWNGLSLFMLCENNTVMSGDDI